MCLLDHLVRLHFLTFLLHNISNEDTEICDVGGPLDSITSEFWIDTVVITFKKKRNIY